MHTESLDQFDPKEREHVEIYYKDEWLQGVFYEKDDYGVYAKVQILNHTESMMVPLNKIRKFQGSSDLEFYYNFSCLFLGVGIFSLPNTMKAASMFPSIFLFALSLSVVYLTCYRVLCVAEKYCVDNLGNALSIMLAKYNPLVGNLMKWTTTTFIWISTVLCLIGYYSVIYNQGKLLFSDVPEMLFMSSAILCGLLSFMPVSWLSYTSSITIVVTIIIIINMSIELGRTGMNDKLNTHYMKFTEFSGYFQVIGGVTMATCIQYMVPSMYRTMQYRDVNRANTLILWSHITAFGVYTTFCIIAYLKYGGGVKEDILISMESNDWFTTICRVAAIICCLCIAPLIFLTMADEAEGWVVSYYLKKQEKVNQKIIMGLKCFLIVIPALFAYVFAIVELKLDFINHINGVSVLFWFVAVINYVCSENDKSTLMGKLDIVLLVIFLGVSVGCAMNTPVEDDISS